MDEKPAIARRPAGAAIDPLPGEPDATEPNSAGARRTRLVRFFVASAAVVCAAIIIGSAAIISDLRNRAVAEAERQVGDMAFTLAGQIDRSLQAVELLEKKLHRADAAPERQFDRHDGAAAGRL
jgi:hypothetical protein